MIYSKKIYVELESPKIAEDQEILTAASQLKAWGIDAVTFADSPGGNARADSVAMGIKVKNFCGIETIPHICCRDQNKIGLQSRLLGGYLNGIRTFLFVTGDPVSSQNHDEVKGVFHCNSMGLMALGQSLNETIFSDAPVVYGGSLNYDRRKIDHEKKRAAEKVGLGAGFFMTQPVFSPEDLEKVLSVTKNIEVPVLLGLMPLLGKNNALLIKDKIPGIRVPDEVVERFSEKMSIEEAEVLSADILRPMIERSWDRVAGYYLVSQKNRLSAINELMNVIEIVGKRRSL